jgi:hypothetical protein
MNERGGLLLRYATFPHNPRIRTGDGIVYYAVGHGVIFAAGAATTLPFRAQDDETRWPFRVGVSLTETVEFVHDGEPLDSVSIDGRSLRQSIRQHSHIRLSEAEYEAAVQALRMRGSDA